MFGDSAFGFSIILVFMFMFFGIAILLCGWVSRKRYLEKIKACSMAVKAEVVRVECEDQIRMYYSNEDAVSRYYLLTFRYYIGDEWYEVKSKVGGGYDEYRVGDIIKIYVNPYVPTEIFIPVTGGSGKYLEYLLMLGTVLVIFCIGVVLVGKRKKEGGEE